ncbi:EAL domain-containing protein [Propionivibrio sp.]|uniref:EAL and HDOD domain-containing protein n=1 Tax=Propionivibrio sp. TaxID=2212460 RepID=UPI0025D2ED25|nr:EAL domain-containing protein [Propionivibrio sp.]MBK7355831.1 EAL domain-containing protein [Propionivibrio sp.]MBK8400506.1 EAL domain-containing protein [Propionivibrio sp.]MBK8744422.1 EAL domain-containing protein [Propionivibrio sp.]MBK8895231.1 EAL domain-containing protein [Propionivibrio sp.]MBL0206865.1 EAL domain-containing protein [Propionivibrio sp.]
MTDNDLQEVFLGRQPILDRNQQLFAYELLFRSGSAENGNFASFVDGNQATATVITNAFTEFSMADALGPYQGFIKVDHGLLFSDLIYALPTHSVVLEILETVTPTIEMLTRCEQLRGEGYILAIRERPESLDQSRPLLKLAEVIKVDISRVDPTRLKQLAINLKPLEKTILAEKVESNEQMQLCHDLGFDLFQGYYFAHPVVIKGKSLHTSELSLLRLLGLLSQDADHAEVETVFKQEPMLTYNLLRLTNSVGAGMTTRITSLRHAITMLGRRQLLRWLQLLLYSGVSGSRQAVNPLLQLAATRGRLMELLVVRTPGAKAGDQNLIDQAYMVGILSLMPTLVGHNMSEILTQLPVAQPVLDALGSRNGALGDLLSLVEALEEEDGAHAARMMQRLPGIDAKYANSCLTNALGWANNLARECS